MLVVSVRTTLLGNHCCSDIRIVNDILKGYGNGGSKQHAKEAAARQAYYSMGWAPREFFVFCFFFVQLSLRSCGMFKMLHKR